MGCANGAWRVFCTFFIVEEWIMRVILDTDKKTITVPWNYTTKLEEINRMVKEYGGDNAKPKTFSGFLDECWKYAMEHSDTNLKTAQKPKKDDDRKFGGKKAADK